MRHDLEEHVKALSTLLINSLNTRTFAQVAGQMCDSRFDGFHDMNDDSVAVGSRSRLIKFITDWLDENPDFHAEITKMDVTRVVRENVLLFARTFSNPFLRHPWGV